MNGFPDDSMATVDRLKYANDILLPALERARDVAGECEGLVNKVQWPYPSMHQLLIHHQSVHSGQT